MIADLPLGLIGLIKKASKYLATQPSTLMPISSLKQKGLLVNIEIAAGYKWPTLTKITVSCSTYGLC